MIVFCSMSQFQARKIGRAAGFLRYRVEPILHPGGMREVIAQMRNVFEEREGVANRSIGSTNRAFVFCGG